MNTFSILTAQIGMFVIYMLAGVILIRTRVMNRENLEVISKFVIKLALPVMIFINTVNGVERKTLFHSLSIFLIAGIMYICLFLLSYISGIFFHLHGNHRQLQCHERIRKCGIYGYSHSNQYLSGKRYALHLCIYHY